MSLWKASDWINFDEDVILKELQIELSWVYIHLERAHWLVSINVFYELQIFICESFSNTYPLHPCTLFHRLEGRFGERFGHNYDLAILSSKTSSLSPVWSQCTLSIEYRMNRQVIYYYTAWQPPFNPIQGCV